MANLLILSVMAETVARLVSQRHLAHIARPNLNIRGTSFWMEAFMDEWRNEKEETVTNSTEGTYGGCEAPLS